MGFAEDSRSRSLRAEEFEFEAVEVRAGVGAGVVADAVEDVDGGAWGESGAERGPAGGAAAPAESGDGGRGVVGLGAAGLGELQADVLVLDEADRRGESEVAGEEDRFGVASLPSASTRCALHATSRRAYPPHPGQARLPATRPTLSPPYNDAPPTCFRLELRPHPLALILRSHPGSAVDVLGPHPPQHGPTRARTSMASNSNSSLSSSETSSPPQTPHSEPVTDKFTRSFCRNMRLIY